MRVARFMRFAGAGFLTAAALLCFDAAQAQEAKYTGSGSCASSSCHGSLTPKQVSRVLQNEYTTWAGQDKHARAYDVLANDVSIRMGKILGIGNPQQAPKCLACHALTVTDQQRARSFDASEGVACESCHGPASAWLGPHTDASVTHETLVKQYKMADLRNPAVRANQCLTCHLGDATKAVDHQMIAAGHPDLTFELGLFTAYEPPHWKEPAGYPWRGVQLWATGQAVQLRDNMERLARRAKSGTWPEYSELECFACHHSLTRAEDSWRQKRGYAGEIAGAPEWNASRFAVFRYLAQEIDPDSAKQLEAEITRLHALYGQGGTNREQILAVADRVARLADRLVAEFNQPRYDRAMTLRLMKTIAKQGRTIAQNGERSAEQAAMSLDTLFNSYRQNVSAEANDQIHNAIHDLFRELRDPSAYNAPNFAQGMERVAALLPAS
jgi:Cytochrome c554 and c-prime